LSTSAEGEALDRPWRRVDPFLMVTISGGGSRAAAYGLGVLEELARWTSKEEPDTSLLDHVAVLSSVSGGSLTAAWYALHDKDFDRLAEFLSTPQKWPLIRRALKPTNWGKTVRRRSDLFAEHLDDALFDHKTLADLDPCGPALILSATDLGSARRFAFIPRMFQIVGWDPATIPIARAVAASAAFPVLTNPVTFENQAPEGVTPPRWVMGAEKRLASQNLPAFRRAQDWRRYSDRTSWPWLHLADGGMSDNTGVRGLLEEFAISRWEFSPTLREVLAGDQTSTLATIAVNSRVPGINDAASRKSAPWEGAVLHTAITSAVNLRTDDSMVLQEDFWRMNAISDGGSSRSGKVTVKGGEGVYWNLRNHRKAYGVYVGFDLETDDALRRELERVPTNYWIGPEQMQLVREAGGRALNQDLDFRALCLTTGFVRQDEAR